MGSATTAAAAAEKQLPDHQIAEGPQPGVAAGAARGRTQLLTVLAVLATAACQVAWLAAICWLLVGLFG